MLLNTNNGATFPGLTLKAWAQVSAAGAIIKSFNVTSVTKGATGIYTLNFTNALATNSFLHKLTAIFIGNTGMFSATNVSSKTTAQITYTIEVGAVAAPANTDMLHFIEIWE